MYLCDCWRRSCCGVDFFPDSTPQKDLIITLVITIFVEGLIVSGYSLWREKPLGPILLTSIVANVVTQSLLWVALNLFFQHYLITLVIAEIVIWMIESLLLYCFSANQLRLQEAALLSLFMNLTSFALGWFLPV